MDQTPQSRPVSCGHSLAATDASPPPTTSTTASTRAPPGRARQSKAPVIRDESWERHKERIIQLHIWEAKTLQQVADIFQRDFNFAATQRQWRSRISKWGLDKNVKTGEMAAISQLREQRRIEEPQKRRRKFEVRGIQVSDSKITRFEKSKAAKTPLITAGVAVIPPDVKYWTASESSGSSAEEQSDGPASPNSSITSPTPSTLALQGSENTESELPVLSVSGLTILSPQPPSPVPFNKHLRTTQNTAAQPNLEQEGALYHSRGRYKAAAEIYRRLAKQARRRYGLHSEQFIASLMHMGETLLNQGRAFDARKLLERLYSLSLTLPRGEMSPLSLACLSSLCRALTALGNLSEAKKYHLHALEISRKANRPLDIETLLHLVGLADAFRATGQLSEAISIYERLLQCTDPQLDFPTVQAWTGLAVAYSLQANCTSAIRYGEQALNRVQKTKGDDHPNSLSRQDDLTAFWACTNQLSQAEATCQATYEKKCRVLGPEHPETLLNRQIMVRILLRQNRVDEASRLCQEVLENQGRVHGAIHPRTTASKLLMVDIWQTQGEIEKATALFEECQNIRGRMLEVGYVPTGAGV